MLYHNYKWFLHDVQNMKRILSSEQNDMYICICIELFIIANSSLIFFI